MDIFNSFYKMICEGRKRYHFRIKISISNDHLSHTIIKPWEFSFKLGNNDSMLSQPNTMYCICYKNADRKLSIWLISLLQQLKILNYFVYLANYILWLLTIFQAIMNNSSVEISKILSELTCKKVF